MATRTITVRRRLKAPGADLFAVLTDPERFARVRGVRRVEILRAGPDGPTGVGTLRRVDLAVGFLVEEIVGLGPTRFDYLIRDASVPIDHRFGRIEFHDREAGTEAVWISTFAVGLPLVGPALALGAALGSHAAFAVALGAIDRIAGAR